MAETTSYYNSLSAEAVCNELRDQHLDGRQHVDKGAIETGRSRKAGSEYPNF